MTDTIELDLTDADMTDLLGPVMGFCGNCQRPVYAAEYSESWAMSGECDDCYLRFPEEDWYDECS